VKAVTMLRDFPYCPSLKVTIQYRGGVTYARVPEAAVRAIVGAGAGDVVNGAEAEQERRGVQKTDEGFAKGNP
jgi:hypothetical protein